MSKKTVHILYQDSVNQMTGDLPELIKKLQKNLRKYKRQGYTNIKFDIILKETQSYSVIRISGEK